MLEIIYISNKAKHDAPDRVAGFSVLDIGWPVWADCFCDGLMYL